MLRDGPEPDNVDYSKADAGLWDAPDRDLLKPSGRSMPGDGSGGATHSDSHFLFRTMSLHCGKNTGMPLAVLLGVLVLTPGAALGFAETDADLIDAYRARAAHVIDRTIAETDPTDLESGNLYTIAANLHRGANVDWARDRLVAINDPPRGDMFWMVPMVLVMHAGRDHWNEEDWRFIRNLWRSYFPYRGDTENHWVMYYVSLYLASEWFPDAGPEAWYNGKSSQENMAGARSYILDWVRVTTSYGQGEYDSPKYIEEFVRPMALLAGWARDPELRQIGGMMLDYLLLDYAAENLNGLYGGAHSRVYPRDTLQPASTAAAALGWFLFNQGDAQIRGTLILLAMSGYVPPPILHRIAHDRGEPYVHRELKRTRWRLRNAGPDAFEVDGRSTVPVYKYSYVHPDYILGSSQGGLLQPIQQRTWSLIWREEDPSGVSNTMFGLHPYSSPFEGTMYFPADWDTVTDLIARSKADYDSPDKLASGSPYEEVFQHKSALIALYDIPQGTRFPLIHTLFSRDLRHRVIDDESGWIFARGGPVYIAYRPLAEGDWKPVDWTGLMHGGAGGWFSAGFEEYARGSESFVSRSLKNGYIVQVAPVAGFESYGDFREAIRALPLEYSLEPEPAVAFTCLDGYELEARHGSVPAVDGVPLDYDAWPLFDGPFARAGRESRSLEIRHGRERYFLDFVDNRVESSTLSEQ